MREENIYIESLKFGYANADKGVSYWEMINYLESKSLIDANDLLFHEYYFTWFFDNFYHRQTYMDRRQNRTRVDERQTAANQTPNEALMFRQHYISERFLKLNDINVKANHLHEKAFMMFDARQNYLNYLYLKESNRSANEANQLSRQATDLTESSNQLSKWAIRVSVGLGTISLILGAFQLWYAIKQDQREEASKSDALIVLDSQLVVGQQTTSPKPLHDTTNHLSHIDSLKTN
jgi:hypothetical protein